MSKVYVFFATGFEEVEALTIVDILRRAKVEVEMVSVTGERTVTSSHGVTVTMDRLFDEIDDSADMLVLPGGMPGTLNLKAHKGLTEMIKSYSQRQDKRIAAICAAPTVFGEMGLLQGRSATCYPGMEDKLIGADRKTDEVVVDGNIITSRGMGTAIEFGLKIVSILINDRTAEELASTIVYNR